VTAAASKGATRAGSKTTVRIPEAFTAPSPLETSVAPTIPPIRAWEELDGNPRYHVARFHAIAPTSPANTTPSVISAGDTMSSAIVSVTFNEIKLPRS
jgi:hypothetical protein